MNRNTEQRERAVVYILPCVQEHLVGRLGTYEYTLKNTGNSDAQDARWFLACHDMIPSGLHRNYRLVRLSL